MDAATTETPPKAKPAGKTAVVAKGANGKAAASVDVSALAVSTLLDIITKNGDTIKSSRVPMAAFRALIEDPNRDAVKKLLSDPKFIAGIEEVVHDVASQTLSLAS